MTVHEEIETLLPWYVTGRLCDTERKRVEHYLEDHPEVVSQLALVRDENDSSIFANEALGAPRAGGLSDLLGRIEAEDGPVRASLVERISGWLPSFDAQNFQVAALAAVVLIVAQAIIIGALMSGGPSGPGFETATGPSSQRVQNSAQLLISFKETATAGEIAAVLLEIGGRIVNGPKAGGIYEVSLLDKTLTVAQKDSLVEKLQKRTSLIGFVSVTE